MKDFIEPATLSNQIPAWDNVVLFVYMSVFDFWIVNEPNVDLFMSTLSNRFNEPFDKAPFPSLIFSLNSCLLKVKVKAQKLIETEFSVCWNYVFVFNLNM